MREPLKRDGGHPLIEVGAEVQEYLGAVFERGDEAQSIQDLQLVPKNVGRERGEPHILLGGERVVDETDCCVDANPLALFSGSQRQSRYNVRLA
jgi:hypothetical protein